MADIVLAEHQGQAWLVGGEGHIDDLLAGTLNSNLTIEFVFCESRSDIITLWVQYCGQPTTSGMPWMIHPAIASRLRGKSVGHRVFFTPWSAMLDEDAKAVIGVAAARAAAAGGASVVLTRYLDAGGLPVVADLADLRSSLIEAWLVGLGVEPGRIVRDTRAVGPGTAAEREHIDIDIDIAVCTA
jgi:hypothetical protein